MVIGKIKVTGTRAYTIEALDIPQGIVGATVSFDFSEDWNGLKKNVVFIGAKDVEILDIQDSVNLPPEVVAAQNVIVKVGVVGVDANKKMVIPTLWADLGTVKPGAPVDMGYDPTLPIWAQLLGMIGDLRNLNTVDKSSLVAAVNEVMSNSGGGNGAGAGGYYTPVVTQPTANTMKISFVPSVATMPAVEPVTITLPGSDSGQNGNYVLPVGGAELGGVKNGGNVVINTDGTMTAPVSSDNTESGNTAGNVVCTFLDAYVAWKNGESFPVAFIGDSTFAGTGSGADKAFPVVLQELLREECGENATIYNVSVAGTSLGNGVGNFENNFGDSGAYADTKIICIGYGINDRLGHSTYKSYKNAVYANVETLVKKCFEKGIQPVIVTSQATSECGVASNYTQYPLRNAEAMNTCANGAKKDVAEKYGVPLIDLNRFTELYMTNSREDVSAIIPDRLHFSAIGNKYEAGVMFKHFVPRTINYSGNDDKIISLSNQNLVCTIPEDKISYGGDYKVYANYAKSDSTDAKIIDAYLFVEDYPVLLNAVKNDANSGTYVKVNGDDYPIDGTAAIICELDLGLHHLEVYTGASTSVDFCAFVVNALGIGQETVAVTGITLDKTELTVGNTKEGTIVATVTPGDATNKKVIWTTDNENICSVSNGVVTGKGVGSCVVTATTVDGGFTATCNVTVTPVEMAIDTKDSTLETQSVGANFAVFTPNYDEDAKTTALSNTTVKSVELNYSAAGTISFGKVNLNNATKNAVEDVKEYTVDTTGFVVIDIDDIALGENDAFCIVGGTASFLLLKAWEKNEGYNLGWGGVVDPSSYGLYGRIVYE